jgi:nitric oxide reductase activation protein
MASEEDMYALCSFVISAQNTGVRYPPTPVQIYRQYRTNQHLELWAALAAAFPNMQHSGLGNCIACHHPRWNEVSVIRHSRALM